MVTDQEVEYAVNNLNNRPRKTRGYLTPNEIAAQTNQALPALRYTSFAPPLVVRPVFRTEQMRDDFNAGLQQLKSSGRYEKIIEEYLDQQ